MVDNRQRAEALLEDLKAYNPKMIRKLKREKINVLDYLEQFLNVVREKELGILEVMKSRIPAGLDPIQYERELNWARQTARETAQEEINQLLRS